MKSVEKMRGWVVDMATCRDVGRTLQSYLDGELDTVRVAKVERHLERCLKCGMETETYTRIKKALVHAGEGGHVHPGDRLAIERLRRFADTLSTSAPPGEA